MKVNRELVFLFLVTIVVSYTAGYKTRPSSPKSEGAVLPMETQGEADRGFAAGSRPEILSKALVNARAESQPVDRAAQEEEQENQRYTQFVDEAAALIEPELRELLSESGFSSEEIQRILTERRMLHWQAREAGESRQKLVQSRIDYDRSLKETLGDVGYEKYRALETRKRIEPSVQALKALASESGVPFSEPGSKAASDLMAKYVGSVRLDERWNGPYDPLPRPSGGVSGAEEMRRDLMVLEAGSNQLLAEASGLLTEHELSLLKRLIDKKVEEITYGIRAFTRTREELRAARERILAEPSHNERAKSP
jgi:hypothetical protein